MKKILFLALFACIAATGFAQQAAKAMFFELGGPGLASFNYDTRFTKKEDGIGGRIGFGGFKLGSNSQSVGAIFVPVGLNYLIGKDGKHYFEVGAGATFVGIFTNNDDPYDNHEDGNFESTFGHLNFGYRLQPADGGFFFRAAINPIFDGDSFIPYYAGVAFGYKFGNKKKEVKN